MFHGSMVALVTPMHEDGTIDYAGLEKLLQFHLDGKTDALVMAGTTGEGGTLTAQEKKQLFRATVSFINNRLPVIAGASAVSTQESIELARIAMSEGVDAILSMTPPYVKPTQEGLFLHHQAIAQAVAIPQILYNVPSRTACDMQPETVGRLSRIANIVGIKEATASLSRLVAIQESAEGRISIYSGDDPSAGLLMRFGAKGVISVSANVIPEKMHALCELCTNQQPEAITAEKALQPLHKALFLESNPIPTKWALHQMGLIEPWLRLPLTPLAQQYHQALRDELIAQECMAG